MMIGRKPIRPKPIPKPKFILSSKDLVETKDFYSKLFGWKFQTSGDYAMFHTSTKGIGGGFQLTKKITAGTTHFYVTVDNIPDAQRKAEGLGGRIVKRKTRIGGGRGYWGTIKDPHGNIIGLWSRK